MRVPGRTLNQTRQPLAVMLALLLIGVGFISMPGSGQASATGVAAGKFGSDQVFSTTGLVTSATCVSGTPTTFSTITVTRSGLENPVTMTTGRYVSLVTTGDSAAPWGAKLFESDGSELRLNGSEWITDAAASALVPAVSFDTLRVLSSAGNIYALSDQGFIFSGADVGELFISNAGPLTGSVSYIPSSDFNDCVASATLSNFTAATTVFEPNQNPNQDINQTDPGASSAVTWRSSIGDFSESRAIIPMALNSSHVTGFTYELIDDTQLPPGLELDTTTGILSGTPSTAAPYSFTVGVNDAGTRLSSKAYQGKVHSTIVLNNTALRFGNGTENSVNSIGLFQQPWYNAASSGAPVWKKLTFSSLPLNMAIGTGSTNNSHWSGSSVTELGGSNPQQFDFSQYEATNDTATAGYGKIRVITTFTINSQSIEVDTTYSLGQYDNFVKVENKVTNRESVATVSNLHIWVGTRDDWVGDTDTPTKEKGNLSGPNGSFQPITTKTQQAQALQIRTGAEGVLFYSTTANTNMAVTNYGSFSNVYNLNPVATDITITNDGAYAAVLPAGDILPGASKTITWFYAAGTLTSLDAVSQAVAAAAAPPPPVVERNDSSATIAWDAPEVEAGATIIGYNYRYSTNGGSTWITSADLPASPRSAIISGLSNEDSFIFQVRAITRVGSDESTRANGAWSGSSESEVLGAPEVPTLNSATGSDGSISITFTAPVSPISPITHYQYCLNSCDTPSNWLSFLDNSDPPVATVPTSPATIPGVANGSSYQVRLRAVNIHGASNPSDAVSAVTKPVWTTSSLGNLYTGTSFGLNLSVGASVSTYAVVAGAVPTGLALNTSTGRVSGTATSGGSYSFTVRATNGGGFTDRTFTGQITPFWTPSTTTISGTTTSELNAELDLASAVLSSNTSGSTVSVTGLPAGVSLTTSRVSEPGQIPGVTLTGTPEEAGTYTITVTITDSAGRAVSRQFSLVVTVGTPTPVGGGTSTPVPTPTPSVSASPRPLPSVSPTPAGIRPQVVPTPTPTPERAPTQGPVLIPKLEPLLDAVFTPTNPIPQLLVDILSQPLAYVLSVVGTPELPELGPTESLAYENGTAVSITLVLNETASGYVMEGDGWVVSLEATDPSGTPLVLDDSGNILLNLDRVVTFSGTGFAPGSIIKVWLFSDPAEISEVVADANGNFVGQAQLPAGIPTGEHTVQLNGLTEDGQLRSVSLGVVVQPDPVIAPAPPVGFDLTGLLNFLWILAAGVLIWFFIVGRRRKKKEEDGEIPNNSGFEELPIFASEGFEPSQQFPNDSRRKIGAASPPNRKRFGLKPKGV